MQITYDPPKRLWTLQRRSLDFEDAEFVFAGSVLIFEDARSDYGEPRMLCVGELRGRMVMVGFVQRGDSRHVFSMRKCHAREIKKYETQLQHAG